MRFKLLFAFIILPVYFTVCEMVTKEEDCIQIKNLFDKEIVGRGNIKACKTNELGNVTTL